MNPEVFEIVVQSIGEILMERREPVPGLKPETPISASGLDSLDIATLTVRLDGQIGRVPEEALRQYPQTLGELAALYARYRKLQPVSEAI